MITPISSGRVYHPDSYRDHHLGIRILNRNLVKVQDHKKNPSRKERDSLERKTGFEPATSTLARSRSTN